MPGMLHTDELPLPYDQLYKNKAHLILPFGALDLVLHKTPIFVQRLALRFPSVHLLLMRLAQLVQTQRLGHEP